MIEAWRTRPLGGLRRPRLASHRQRPNPTVRRGDVVCLVLGGSFCGEQEFVRIVGPAAAACAGGASG
jgi:hypothetical protein